ncbi:hypothetical protein BX266_7370 [Streptomyces sp. TLI_171]|nr:hypothetical protein BX266_7370 [Streptomyces sp. TLI_171]
MVVKQSGGPRAGSVEYSSMSKASIANYPSPVTIDYKNTASFQEKPEPFVSEELHLTCTNIKPDSTPNKFTQMVTMNVPPGSTVVADLTCPDITTLGDPWATYPGNINSTEIAKNGHRAAIAFWNDSNSAGVARFGVYCYLP